MIEMLNKQFLFFSEVVDDGYEDLLLALKVAVKRSASHTRSLNDVAYGCCPVAFARKNGRRCIQQFLASLFTGKLSPLTLGIPQSFLTSLEICGTRQPIAVVP